MPENIDVQNQLQLGLGLPSDKKQYFNGFVASLTASDIVIVLQVYGQPQLVLNTSLVIAKELVTNLGMLIQDYETKTGQEVMSLEKLNASLSNESG